MRNHFYFLVIVFLLTGCLSMPDPVKDEFLVNQSDSEQKKMDEIAQVIISKRKEKEKVDADLKLTAQEIIVANKKVPALEKEKDLILEKQKYYSLQNNDAMVKKSTDELEKNDRMLAQEKIYIKYLQIKKENQIAILELKQAELSVKVSELELEKAKIARAFQEKEFVPSETETDKNKVANKNLIDVAKYENYFNKQKDLLVNKQQNQVKTDNAFKEAQKELEKSGFQQDQ